MVSRLTRRFFLFSIIIMLIMACSSQAADEHALKANFLYRFAQFTHWPPPPKDQVRFCVVEHPELLLALQQLLLKTPPRAVQAKTDLSVCDVLMFGLRERPALQQWQQKIKGKPLLIVTDNSEAYRQLGMIQLLTSPDGISFQVDLTRTSAHQLKLGSQLLKLARQVD